MQTQITTNITLASFLYITSMASTPSPAGSTYPGLCLTSLLTVREETALLCQKAGAANALWAACNKQPCEQSRKESKTCFTGYRKNETTASPGRLDLGDG